MATPFDPNFEFNAPKFHDFTNPCQDDDADSFFETCDHESLPTGASNMQQMNVEQEDEHAADAEGTAGSIATQSSAITDKVQCASSFKGVGSDANVCTDKENKPSQTRASSNGGQGGVKSASTSGAGGVCKTNSKLTDSIIALAGFKDKEAELTQIARSTVAAAAATSSSLGTSHESPVAARTRRSLEAKSQGDRRFQSSAVKATVSPSATLSSEEAIRKAQQSEEKKRAHKAGASTTPYKSFAKKPRTEEKDKEAKTPSFSRFGAARGRATGVSSTPNGRSSSAPATGRPSMTPRSARKPVDTSASPSLLRPTSSSMARASDRSSSASRLRPSAAPSPARLTVPQSPKFATSSRPRKRGVDGEYSSSSISSLGDASVSRQSLSSACKLTVPKSPKLRSTTRSRQSVSVNTDEAKLREAQEAVENLKKRRKLGEARLKNVLEAKTSAAPALSTKGLTVPQSPNLSARSRAKDLNSSSSSYASEGELPFRERMLKSDQQGGGRSKTPVSKRDEGPRQLTEPKTPNFSSFRRKETKVKSFAEREEEALAQAKRNQFKARPLNRSALDSCGDLGVPKVARKALTTAVGPKLSTEERGERSRSSSMNSLQSLSSESLSSVGSSSFKARRVPKATHHPTTSVAAQPRQLTIPVSPNLRSTSRMRNSSMSSGSSEEDLSKSFKALDMPDFSRKFVPKHDHTKLTEPAPFNLSTDQRHARYEAELKSKKEAEEKKAQEERRYKAKPVRALSDLATVGVSHVSKKPLTEPKPFSLRSEAKHEHASSQWTARVDRELAEEQSKFSSFHARSVPKAINDASRVYTPRRSSKPLTEVQEVQLNVDRRSQRHQELSEKKIEREKRLQAERLAEVQRRKEEEAHEIRMMRTSMVVKAKPVPTSVYNGAPSVVHSSKPLTEPMSPHFRTDMRLRTTRT